MPGESPVFPREQTDGRTDMTKMTVAFRNSKNARNKCKGDFNDFRIA